MPPLEAVAAKCALLHSNEACLLPERNTIHTSLLVSVDYFERRSVLVIAEYDNFRTNDGYRKFYEHFVQYQTRLLIV